MRRPALVRIIPRWEWRIFGTEFGAAEAALAASTPGLVEESDELYLLSAAGANVKVRYGLMDIKLLREVDGDGLERWEPVMKAGFPLPAAEVRVARTIAVESEDPSAVMAAVRSLGLSGQVNTSYPRGLWAAQRPT